MSDTERGQPAQQTRRGSAWTPARRNAAVALAGAAFIAWNFYSSSGHPTETRPPTPGGQSAITASTVAQLLGPPPPPEPRREEPPMLEVAPPRRADPMPDAGESMLGGSTRKRVVSYPVSQQHALSAQAQTPAEGRGQDGRAAPRAAPASTGVTFAGTNLPGRRAGAAIDQTLTLMPGIYGCTLDVAISSERPGPFFCHTTRDIKSPHNVTLMEAGTRIQGSFDNAVGSGQSRIMALSATAFTPEGVPVPLGGPIADQAGRVGMSGHVDTHLWERLRGAVILMLTQGAMQAASAGLQAAVSRGGGNTFLNLQAGGVEGAIAQALREGATIQSTVTLNAGSEIAFYVTEPISFADSYSLSTIGGQGRGR